MQIILELKDSASITRLGEFFHTMEHYYDDVVEKYHFVQRDENKKVKPEFI